jgi:non-heme chloroperoxidase
VTFQVPGVRLAGDAHGTPGALPVILLHGGGQTRHAWGGTAAALAAAGWYAVALDLRGHGDSETTPYYDFGHFVLDLRNLIRALRLERPYLIGHSMGGEIVADYCGSFPEVPARVVLIEGLGPPPLDMDREVQRTIDGFARIDRALLHAGLKDLEAAYGRLRERNHRLSETRARELAVLGTRAREDGTLEWKFDPMLATMDVTGPFNLDYAMAFWRRVTAPTLVIHGGESGEFWRGAPGRTYLEAADRERRLACFREVRFVEIPGAGHMVHFDRPRELLGTVRDFLLGKAPDGDGGR